MMKRLFDLTAACLGLLVVWPVLAALAVWIKLDSPGPVFFRGQRIGRNGKPFRIFKFRTMVVDADKKGPLNVGADDPRITRLGAFLRKSKLDELPQLLNVVTGEMSVVGPRPDVAEYVGLYSPEERDAILALKPGLTDWASIVNFDQWQDFTRWENPDQSFVEAIRPLKVKLQMFYAQEHNLWVDLKIIVWTARKMVLRDAAMPPEVMPYLDLRDGRPRLLNSSQ